MEELWGIVPVAKLNGAGCELPNGTVRAIKNTHWGKLYLTSNIALLPLYEGSLCTSKEGVRAGRRS